MMEVEERTIKFKILLLFLLWTSQTLLLNKLGHSKILPDLELLKSYTFVSPVKYLRRTIH